MEPGWHNLTGHQMIDPCAIQATTCHRSKADRAGVHSHQHAAGVRDLTGSTSTTQHRDAVLLCRALSRNLGAWTALAVHSIARVLSGADAHTWIHWQPTGRKLVASIGCQTEACSEDAASAAATAEDAAGPSTPDSTPEVRRPRDVPKPLGSRGATVDSKPEVPEILCVDDDKLQLMLLKRVITKAGMRFTPAENAQQALDILHQRASEGGVAQFPEQIIMDIHMPGMSGIEAMEIIDRRYPNVQLPITLCSSEQGEVLRGVELQAQATSYLFKPFTPASVIACVTNQRKVTELQRRSKLLNAILPTSVISRLNSPYAAAAPKIIADYQPNITVLFSDIVGYTAQAAKVSTPEVMHVLHHMFSYFDLLTDVHGVLKVETIGDAYMVASGHEESSRDDHTTGVLKMAADMLKVSEMLSWPDGTPVTIRVGIHSGPSYSGVVGRKSPRFCLFGDTVNTASRMESTGFPGCVQLSEAAHTAALAQARYRRGSPGHDAGHLEKEFVMLGTRQIKGKGRMRCWLSRVGNWESALESWDGDMCVPKGLTQSARTLDIPAYDGHGEQWTRSESGLSLTDEDLSAGPSVSRLSL